MKKKIQEAVNFFNNKFGLKKEVKLDEEIPFPQRHFVKIRVGAASRTKDIVVDLYCKKKEVFEELKNIIKSDKGMNDIYKEVSDSMCFTVENQSIEEQCKLIENLYDKWQQKY